MATAKINLSAFNKANQNDEIIENTNNNVISEQENDEQSSLNKKKFSFKDFKKSENTESIQTTVIQENQEIQNEDIQNEITKEVIKKISITDGDTNCNIIKDGTQEIFWNYKGSFSPIEENIKIEEKTSLEKYSKSEDVKQKSKKRKIILTSWISIAWVLIFLGFIFQNNFIKWNIQEVKINHIIEEQEEQKNEIIDIIDLEKENNQTIQNDIVKKNIEIKIDKNENLNNINKKIHGLLIEKYKAK